MEFNLKVFIYFLLLPASLAFIFDDERDEIKTISIVNYKYKECQNDRIVLSRIKKFKTVYDKIRYMSDDDMDMIKERGYQTALPVLCESKKNLASSVTDFVEFISRECVKDQRERKKFSLNSLLILQTMLDFFCGMNETIFKDIYQNNVVKYFREKKDQLDECRKKSFDLVFFDKAPEKLFWVQLVNGSVCNFNYEKMLNCAEELKFCGGGTEALAYLFEVIRKNSVCYVRKNISEIIESASGDQDNIVSDY